ncbi:MAG: (deoxy)nucleoside triphosphate pyrophosphohydrolase [Bdellovibrionaceae bacterium]|nr:(deoxy)nucleoside triphosphate pyrophosphohydrolase [Pseudobdellovibrionaceae bacterium]
MSSSGNTSKPRLISVVALALRHRPTGQFMLARRGPLESGAGQWEFPGGKVEDGETSQQALIREIQEELSFDLSPFEQTLIGRNRHRYPDKEIELELWLVEVDAKPDFILIDHDQTRWLLPSDMKESDLSDGDKPFISLIKSI